MLKFRTLRGFVLLMTLALVATGTAPVAATSRTYSSISTGGNHTCALTARGDAFCWGRNSSGQLGNGDYGNIAETENDKYSSTPVAVLGHLKFASISAGDRHTCALTPQGKAYCWGRNHDGELGDGTTNDSNEAGPQAVLGGRRWMAIVAFDSDTCALTPQGKAYCWGSNQYGELGNGTTNDSNEDGPQAVLGGYRFASLSAQEDFVCALTRNGRAYCWGYNGERGQLGNGTASGQSERPQSVIGSLRFSAIQVGSDGACGLTTRGQTYCWGEGYEGVLGDGGTTNTGAGSPIPIIGGLRFASFPMTSGESHRCALTKSGAAYCWGANDKGQIGDGTGTGEATAELLAMGPRKVIGDLRFASISVSENHSCALTARGRAYCWGENDFGELGDGTRTDSDEDGPQAVQ